MGFKKRNNQKNYNNLGENYNTINNENVRNPLITIKILIRFFQKNHRWRILKKFWNFFADVSPMIFLYKLHENNFWSIITHLNHKYLFLFMAI